MGVSRTYDLSDLDGALRTEVLETIRFGQLGVDCVALDDGGAVRVDARDAETLRYVEAFVADMRTARRRMRTKVVHENVAPMITAGDVDEQLARSGELLPLGPGLAGLRGTLLGLFRFFEAEFRALAAAYGADEHHYPVMLPVAVLEELGYFTHFPQQVTFCSHLPEDLPLLEEMVQDVKTRGGTLPSRYRRLLTHPEHALKPAVCLPSYRQYRDRVLARGTTLAVTMQNHVFRYEGLNFRSLARLWDFTVRDVVFFDDYARLLALRAKVMERAIALCRELGLTARVQLANDPFFLNESRGKRVYQRLGEVKYELVLVLPQRGEDLAVSSFNLHRDFYTGIYNVRFTDGERAESACMGFGLERWLYGFVSQRGLDPGRWPSRVAAFVGARAPDRP